MQIKVFLLVFYQIENFCKYLIINKRFILIGLDCGFQDRRNRPLCHPSFVIIISSLISQADRLESCSLPIYFQLSGCPAIQDTDNYGENYTDRESVFASFSWLLSPKFKSTAKKMGKKDGQCRERLFKLTRIAGIEFAGKF